MSIASEATILVSVDASDPEEPSDALVELLSPHSLVILGYWQVPDQSSTGQLRSQFGEEATAAIDEVTARFVEAGADVDSTVVFTHDWYATIEKAATDYDVDGVLTADPFEETFSRVLVPIRGDKNLERIVAFVALLLRGSDAHGTLFNVADTEEEAQTAEFILRGAADRLEEEGVDPERLDWRQERSTSPENAIITAAADYDLIVVGESEPSLRERLLGRVTNQVIKRSPVPALVIRRK